jgi:two-component system, NarL family, nitrate/nitrite response regulator NarL
VAPIDVVVASGVRFYAEGLAQALATDGRISVMLAVPDVDALVSTLVNHTPDVVLLDLAGMDEITELREIVAAAAPVRFVALAVREHDADVIGWAEAGVAGIVTRSASLGDLSDAIFASARGESPCSPTVPGVLLRWVAAAARERPRDAPMKALTAREREIADLLALGLTNKEIAARLYLGVSTVKNHVHNVLRKLDAPTRIEAVARMRRASGVMDVAVRAAAAARPAVVGTPLA